jgi:hypothetical protein
VAVPAKIAVSKIDVQVVKRASYATVNVTQTCLVKINYHNITISSLVKCIYFNIRTARIKNNVNINSLILYEAILKMQHQSGQ